MVIEKKISQVSFFQNHFSTPIHTLIFPLQNLNFWYPHPSTISNYFLGLDLEQRLKKVKCIRFILVEEVFAPRKGILHLKKGGGRNTNTHSEVNISMDSRILDVTLQDGVETEE